MTNLEIIRYLGRIIDDVNTVEEKIMNEEDVDVLRDILTKLHKLRIKYNQTPK
jgi:hypothetical protein